MSVSAILIDRCTIIEYHRFLFPGKAAPSSFSFWLSFLPFLLSGTVPIVVRSFLTRMGWYRIPSPGLSVGAFSLLTLWDSRKGTFTGSTLSRQSSSKRVAMGLISLAPLVNPMKLTRGTPRARESWLAASLGRAMRRVGCDVGWRGLREER